MPTYPFNPDQAFRWAMEAVREAGKILATGFRRNKTYKKKGAIDLVTEWDIKSQKTILSRLRPHFPLADFLVEESGTERRDSPLCWILDPLDGTTNFVHGFPFFCISLALYYEKIPFLAIVHNPAMEETYWALKGKGAFFQGRPIRVSTRPEVSQSLLATGFPYNIKKTHRTIMKRLDHVITRAQGVRRAGSAALDLCWVSRGIIDGFWEEHLKPWDTAAGILLLEEAGEKVSDFSGRPYRFQQKHILATNGLIHQEMIELLRLQQPNTPR